MILLSQEIQRLNNLVQSKNEEIDKLEKDKIDLHSLVSKYKGLASDLDDKEYTINKLKEQLNTCRLEI